MDFGSVQSGLSMLQSPAQSVLFGALRGNGAVDLQAGSSRGREPTDLPPHIGQLAERGQRGDVVDAVLDAVILAGRSPVFFDQLLPLLGDVRSALQAPPADSLSYTDREA